MKHWRRKYCTHGGSRAAYKISCPSVARFPFIDNGIRKPAFPKRGSGCDIQDSVPVRQLAALPEQLCKTIGGAAQSNLRVVS